MAALDEVRGRAGLAPAATILRAPTVAGLLARIPAMNDDPLGPAARIVLGQSLAATCALAQVATALPATCALSGQSPGLGALRLALIADLTTLAHGGIEALRSYEGLREPLSVLAMLEATLSLWDPATMLERLERWQGAALQARGADASTVLATRDVTEIVGRFYRDGLSLDLPEAHYVRIVMDVLPPTSLSAPPVTPPAAGLGLPGFPGQPGAPPIDPVRVRRTQALLEALRGTGIAFAELRSAERVTGRGVALLTARALTSLDRAHELVTGQPAPVEARVRDIALTLVPAVIDGDLEALRREVEARLVELEARGAVSHEALCASNAAWRVATARNTDEADGLARSTLQCAVHLPPWTNKILFAAHGDLPVFSDNRTLVNADLLLGYSGERFGVSIFGTLYQYETHNATSLTDILRTEGAIDAWAGFGVTETVKLDVRMSGGAALYSSDIIPTRGLYLEETSLMGRGQLQVGVRATPSERFAFAFHTGGGFQLEDHDLNNVKARRVVSTNSTPLTARALARLRAQWNFWPDVLALRAAADVSYSQLTTSTTTVDIGPGTSTTVTESQSSQLELFPRAYLDLDILRVLELRPCLTGGANIVTIDGTTSTTPVVGIGIRRESF